MWKKVVNYIMSAFMLGTVDYKLISLNSDNYILAIPYSIFVIGLVVLWNKKFDEAISGKFSVKLLKSIGRFFYYCLKVSLVCCFVFGLEGVLMRHRMDLFPFNKLSLLILLFFVVFVSIPYSIILGFIDAKISR